MATHTQIAANQANAQLSTGPKTEEGKARVAQNAVRHGLTAKGFVVHDDEHEEFEALRAQLLGEIKPEGAVETVTFEELFHAAWNLRRFRRIEAEYSLGAGADFTDPEVGKVLDRLTRYQARWQRAWYRALQELRALQTSRMMREVTVTEEGKLHVPLMTDVVKWEKQTQSIHGSRGRQRRTEQRFSDPDRIAAEMMAEIQRERPGEAA